MKIKPIYLTFSLITNMLLLISCMTINKEMPAVSSTEVTTTNSPFPAVSDRQTQIMLPSETPLNATPFLTLTSLESKAFVDALMKNNGGCSFPCLWGIEPGKVDLEYIENYFEFVDGFQVANVKISTEFASDTYSMYVELSGSYAINSTFKYNKVSPFDARLFITTITQNPPTISFFKENYGYYFLANILNVYGKPQEVLIAPRPYDPDRPNDWIPFNLILFYPDDNFFVEYVLVLN